MRTTLRALTALALGTVIGCTTNGSAPTGFGVNLTIDGTALPPATLKSISSLVVTVTGEKAPYSKSLAGSTISSGAVHVQYIPGITSGTLVFEVNADNGSGSVVASGVSSSITLVAGKAVSATVKLAAGEQPDMGMIALGSPCAHDSDCTSAGIAGHCADGVCCDSACTGTCESCNLTGTAGTCTAIPVNTDPDNECGAVTPPQPSAPPDLGDVDLLGVTPPDLLGIDLGQQYNYPDGGVKTVNSQCAGSCNGSRACAFPGASKTCGTAFCNSPSQVETPVCDGAGSCTVLSPTTCSDYVCGAGACKTQCVSDADCSPRDYCNVNTNECVPKLAVGVACPQGPGSCASGYCVGTTLQNGTPSGTEYCCNSACGYPNSCNETTKEGQCECPGVTCDPGVGCNVFYQDADGDGYGNQSVSQTGCGNTPPGGYVTPVANSSGQPLFDCDDANANAFPGQTAYFTKPRANGSYDYNCDNVDTLMAAPYSTCAFPSCLGAQTTCGTADEQSYLNAGGSFICINESPRLQPIPICRCTETGSVTYGLVAAGTKCGASTDGTAFPGGDSQYGTGNATYRTCGTCAAASAAPATSTNATGPQPCH